MPVSAEPLGYCLSIALNGGPFHVDCWCELNSQNECNLLQNLLVYCTMYSKINADNLYIFPPVIFDTKKVGF